MSQIEFRYTNAQGKASTHRLNDEWEESGKYLTGYSLTEKGPRTFLIYRVTEYLNGSEGLLHDPFQAAPEKVTKQAAPEILFSAFPTAQRRALEAYAANVGMKVVKTMTEGLTYLCVGSIKENNKKPGEARRRGVFILSEAGLKALVETGELPDGGSDFL